LETKDGARQQRIQLLVILVVLDQVKDSSSYYLANWFFLSEVASSSAAGSQQRPKVPLGNESLWHCFECCTQTKIDQTDVV
jgi:hypothetical protein